MLAYILAVFVGTGSIGLYISAFFFPEIHRKQDFVWSGVGFFYALVLWIYARQETGGILVGHVASVSLLSWLAWQTLTLRRQLVPVNQQTPMPNTTKLKQQLGLKQSTPTTAQPATPSAPPVTPPPARSPRTRPPASQEAVPITAQTQKPVRSITQPVDPNPVDTEAAWIRLEVKPASAPAKPLGTAVQPPTAMPALAPSPAVVPEIIAKDIPADPTPTKVELDLESANWD